VYSTVKPEAPASCTVTWAPGARSGFVTKIVCGETYAKGSPVSVSTRLPSLADQNRTVTEVGVVRRRMRNRAGQSFLNTSSGPPQEIVASRPIE
jgi:hypothetical protein